MSSDSTTWLDDVFGPAPARGEQQQRGQLRMAKRLVAQHEQSLRYVHGVGWHIWDGTRWARDLKEAATRAAIDVVERSCADIGGLGRDAGKELLADIHRCQSAAGLDGMLRIARALPPLAVAVDELDADPYMLNTANGTLDLRTGRLRDHNPADLITKITGCGYDPRAQSDTFTRFIEEILPDPAVRGFVARVFGHALPGTVSEHLLPIFTGAGCNGKSTLVDTAAAAFGDYGIAAEPDLLVDRGAVHTTGQADLLGVRLAVCSETDDGRRLAAGTVKRLTGGDKIRARRMRQDNIEFPASHAVIMVTNHKPRVSADDPALWRRLRIVPFDVVVPNPDRSLKERLALDLPAVLAWMVSGHADWRENGLAEPGAVAAATDAYRATSDALGRFLDEHTYATEFGTVKARELFGRWSAWCHTNGEESGSEVTFAAAMEQRGYTKKKSSGGMNYLGLHALAAAGEAG